MPANADDLRQEINRRGRRAVARSTDRLLAELDRSVPRGASNPRRRGQKPMASTRKVKRDPLHTRIDYTATHAGMQNAGIRPHQIRPRTARALVFVWPKAPSGLRPIGGRTLRTFAFRKVNHPGTTKHKGWFDRIVNDRAWTVSLDREMDRP